MNMSIKKRANHRASIIGGQFKGLQKMIEEDAYCVDILTQSLAIQKSIASLNKLILEHHIETHIQSMMSSTDGEQHKKALSELALLYELHNVRGK